MSDDVTKVSDWKVEQSDLTDRWELRGNGGTLATFDNSQEPHLIWAAHNFSLTALRTSHDELLNAAKAALIYNPVPLVEKALSAAIKNAEAINKP